MPAETARRRTFLVGRLTHRTREIQWVEPQPPPLPGPWSLKAVVRERAVQPALRLVR